MRGFLALLIVGGLSLASLGAEEISPQDLAFFEKKVRPALETHCLKCHSQQARAANKLRGGLLLDSAAGWKMGGDTGPALVPGKPAESLLVQSLSHAADLKMPPSGKLPDAVIQDLTEWVRRGAPDPRTARAETTAKTAGMSLDQGRNFWSYRTLANPPVPKTRDTRWPANEVDRFILARQEQQGLSPAPRADDLTLYRRLSFDLTGLPPDPAEALAFATSKDPKKVEIAVDRMLATRAFAERWARHWLDVARFGESVTLRGFIYPNAWRYRDFVIDALAADMPFDQFLRLQIAGDLIPGSTPAETARNRIATSYLVLGNTNFEEQVKKQLDMDVVDDMLDTIGVSMLGQTLGCARCHDHKFDPIPTRDYYALAGIFANVQAMEHANVSKWIDLPLPVDPDTEKALAEREKRIADLEKEIKGRQAGQAKGAKGVLPVKDAPGIVVDDAKARKVGDWQHSTHSGTYIGEGYSHDKNAGKGQKTLTFQPDDLPAGKYAVWLAYSPGDSRSDSVPVTVFCAEGEIEKKVSLKSPPPVDGRFMSLGEFRFDRNVGYVIVSNEGTTGHVTADAVAFVPVDRKMPEKSDDGSALLKKELAELKAKGPERPKTMGVRERDKIADARIHVRGQVSTLGATVPRGFLQVLPGDIPAMPKDQSGRLQLADWIASPNNPLPARVFVNRAWHWLFGAGLTRTVDNFGTTGEKPSHPELLDYLATRFIQEGWSVKKLVRLLVLSSTYQQASGKADPRDVDNRLLSHANRRRLDAECLRDAMLVAGGQLDPAGYGSGGFGKADSDYNFTSQSRARSIYLPVFRNGADPCLEVFDRADPSRVVGARDTSTVAPQALYLLNNPQVRQAAQATASRILTDKALVEDTGRLDRLWLAVLGRHPTAGELEQARAKWPTGLPPEKAWTGLTQALFASPDFRYLD